VKQLEEAIREYIDVHNEDPKIFTWARTADQILDSMGAMPNGLWQPNLPDLSHEPWDRRLAPLAEDLDDVIRPRLRLLARASLRQGRRFGKRVDQAVAVDRDLGRQTVT